VKKKNIKIESAQLTTTMPRRKYKSAHHKDTVVVNNDPITISDHVGELKKLEADSWQPFQLLNPKMIRTVEADKDPTKNYPKWVDPFGRECYGRIVEVYWPKERTVKGKKITESLRVDLSKFKNKLTEGVGNEFALGGPDPFVFGQPVDGNVQYPPGPFTRQLYLQAMWQMQARCFQLKNHDAVAKGLISLLTAFTIGDGIKMDFEDEKAQEVWDEFTERCNFDLRLPTMNDMLCTDGELFFRVVAMSKNGKPGYSNLLTIDASTVWEIITVPKNIFDVKGYWVQYPTQYQLYTVDNIPMADYVVEVVKPDEVVHLKINVYENEKRGRSDLLAVMSDIKLLQDIIRYKAVAVINRSALVFDETVLGQDTDVSSIANVQTNYLGPGTKHTHNESVKLEILTPDGRGEAKSGFQDEMLARIGAGAGNQPLDYVGGGGGGGNRASAITKVEPAYKFFRRRQKMWEFGLKELAKKVIQNAKEGGLLDKSASEEVEVIFAEIAPEDKKEKLGNISFMDQNRYWSHEKAATTAAKEMDDTSYDYEETQKEIKDEIAKDPQLAMLFQPTPPGGFGGAGGGAKAPVSGGASAGVPGQPKAGATAPGAGPTSKSTYGGDKAGLSSNTTKTIKNALNFKQRETNSATAYPSQLRVATPREWEKCEKEMKAKKHPYAETDFGEVAPPGWEPTVKRMKKHAGIDNPFKLAWYMDGQGYKPNK